MSKYIRFTRDEDQIIEGPLDESQIQIRVEELLLEGLVDIEISAKLSDEILEDDREEHINSVGFTD